METDAGDRAASPAENGESRKRQRSEDDTDSDSPPLKRACTGKGVKGGASLPRQRPTIFGVGSDGGIVQTGTWEQIQEFDRESKQTDGDDQVRQTASPTEWTDAARLTRIRTFIPADEKEFERETMGSRETTVTQERIDAIAVLKLADAEQKQIDEAMQRDIDRLVHEPQESKAPAAAGTMALKVGLRCKNCRDAGIDKENCPPEHTQPRTTWTAIQTPAIEQAPQPMDLTNEERKESPPPDAPIILMQRMATFVPLTTAQGGADNHFSRLFETSSGVREEIKRITDSIEDGEDYLNPSWHPTKSTPKVVYDKFQAQYVCCACSVRFDEGKTLVKDLLEHGEGMHGFNWSRDPFQIDCDPKHVPARMWSHGTVKAIFESLVYPTHATLRLADKPLDFDSTIDLNGRDHKDLGDSRVLQFAFHMYQENKTLCVAQVSVRTKADASYIRYNGEDHYFGNVVSFCETVSTVADKMKEAQTKTEVRDLHRPLAEFGGDRSCGCVHATPFDSEHYQVVQMNGKQVECATPGVSRSLLTCGGMVKGGLHVWIDCVHYCIDSAPCDTPGGTASYFSIEYGVPKFNGRIIKPFHSFGYKSSDTQEELVRKEQERMELLAKARQLGRDFPRGLVLKDKVW